MERFAATAQDAFSSTSASSSIPQVSASDTESSSARELTPSSASGESGHIPSHSSAAGDYNDLDPDRPLPSIEHSITESQSLETQYMPNLSVSRSVETPDPSVDSLENDISNLRLSTVAPSRSIPTQTSRTAHHRGRSSDAESNVQGLPAPSSITSRGGSTFNSDSHHPTPSSTAERGTPSVIVESVIDDIDGLTLGPEAEQIYDWSRETSMQLGTPSPDRNNLSAAGTPRPRRRSGSQVDQTPHKVEDEEPPQEPFHNSLFQQAFRNAKNLMAQLTDVLASSSLHHDPDSRMRQLHETAHELSRFESLASRKVGLVGDSGVGKSSLINSLLDFQGLAQTSGGGAACTCVVTEYRYHPHNNFAIEVDYFSTEEIEAQFTELLKCYRQYHLHMADMDENERKDFEVTANIAKDTFKSVFCNRFTQNERLLIDQAESTALDMIQRWVRETILPLLRGLNGIQRRETASTTGQCSNMLMKLTSKSASEPESTREAAIWPFIQKITVYLKAHILSKGLVLVDLPGLRDLNSARVKITERHVLECDEIFAICWIGRATTDAGVKGVLELARKANLSNVGIICTKSDEIVADEAERDWYGEAAAQIRRMIRAIETDEDIIQSIKDELDALTDSDTDDEGLTVEEARLARRLRRAQEQKTRHEFDLTEHLITTRNQIIKRMLQTTYRTTLPSTDLKIFCVSNSIYWDNRSRPREIAKASLELSGVLEVRKHCISIVAQSQLRAATKYIQDEIPALLGSIELWIQSGSGSLSTERKLAIRNALNAVEGTLRGDLIAPSSRTNLITKSMEQKFKEDIYGFMKDSACQWSHEARNASLQWQGWHQSTYAAFCRNYGDHCTPIAGRHCWNDEAMMVATADMIVPWRTLHQAIEKQCDKLETMIARTFDRSIGLLPNVTDTTTNYITTLSEVLSTRQRLLLSAIQNAHEDFEESLLMLKTEALSGIRTSIIGQLMEPSYQAANMEYSTGSDRRRKAIITNGFSDEQLFNSLRRRFKSKFSTIAKNLQDKIKEAITTHLRVVQGDLDTLKNENVVLESERNPQFRRLVEVEVVRIKAEVERIHEVVDQIGSSAV